MRTKRWGVLIAVMLASAWAGTTRAEAQEANLPPEVIRYADTILYNGKILTADNSFTVADAVAVRDGRFMAVGQTATIQRMAGPNTRRIDLKGKTVTPGIIDLHGGPGGSAMMRRWAAKWLSGERQWRTKEEALDGLKRAVAKAKPGEAVILPRSDLSVPVDATRGGRAGNFCDVMTLAEVDAISPDNPMFFIGSVNSTTMAMNSKGADVTRRFLPQGVSTPFVANNSICVDRGADLDGILLPGQMAGNSYVFWLEPPDAMLDVYRDEVKQFSMQGVTLGKQHMGVPLFNGLRTLWERGELNMRFRMAFPMIPQISGHTVELPEGEDAESFFRTWANMSRIGDNMLRIVGLRIPAVGGNVPGGDAWMLKPKIRPYPDRWGNESPFGGRIQEQVAVEKGAKETFRGRDVLIQATRFGWDVSCDHCVGDRSFREVINAFEEGLKDLVVTRPKQRLTTNHTPMAQADDIKRAVKLGVWSSVSTGHVLGGASGRDLEAGILMYGADGLNRMAAPIKSFRLAGGHPSLEGTMWPDTDPRGQLGVGGKSAFFWIGKAITRKDEVHGRVWNKDEALTRQEALWASTLWSAEQLAEDKELGSIEVGKEADLVILDGDYMTVPDEDIGEIRILLTMVGGRVVYEISAPVREGQ